MTSFKLVSPIKILLPNKVIGIRAVDTFGGRTGEQFNSWWYACVYVCFCAHMYLRPAQCPRSKHSWGVFQVERLGGVWPNNLGPGPWGMSWGQNADLWSCVPCSSCVFLSSVPRGGKGVKKTPEAWWGPGRCGPPGTSRPDPPPLAAGPIGCCPACLWASAAVSVNRDNTQDYCEEYMMSFTRHFSWMHGQ